MIRADVADATSGLRFESGATLIEYRRVGSDLWQRLSTELVDGELRAVVDSTNPPPGRYEFRATVRDQAGNWATSGLRADGSPMVLDFPLKEEPELSAHLAGGAERATVPYRSATKVRGLLVNEDGRPVRGAELSVIQRFDDGSLIQRRVSRTTTDAEGRWVEEVPGGPSRRIDVAFAGDSRYAADRVGDLDLNVRSKVRLRLAERKVKAGRKARFRGRVGRYFARVPDGGKLVELQVKEGPHRWNTIDQARGTDPRGRIALAYRFRRFYEERVRFTFRLKATRENAWPYRSPAASRTRKLVVVPRRK